jgi:hypothetical protein
MRQDSLMAMAWLVVVTKPRQEAKAAAHLVEQSFEVYLPQTPKRCTSSDLVEPFDPISKRHFSAGDFSSLQSRGGNAGSKDKRIFKSFARDG